MAKNIVDYNILYTEDLNDNFSSKDIIMLKEIESLGQYRFDRWNNMLISGDNLNALTALLYNDKIKGNIKLIYIDPPFGTNQDFKAGLSRTISKSREDDIAYQDKIIGTEYLKFLKKRLIILRELMSDDASIYVHIDWNMCHYVKILMDEVFGQQHFINNITRIKCNPKSFKRKAYGNMTDAILFYSKSDHYIWNDPREEFSEEQIKALFPKIDKNGRHYTTLPLHAPGETLNGPTGKEWKGIKPPKGSHWQYPPEDLDKLDAQGLIEWSSKGNPRRIYYAKDAIPKGKKRQDLWEFKDPPYPHYPTEKNIDMLKVIIEASSNPDDIVLDCFAGSGTTLVAAEQLSRRWIGIDNSNIAISTAKKRLMSIKNISSFTVYQAEVINNE
ncbi:MAG: site-specific DNA-methyltransferase [Candidatus Cloacimonadaceae bacterium]|jgi:adenine-specific DNA-methyltransferase|nr:site-specific DNA-methyltransferase [Candidatus Cloacimonadota bacterium]MCB5258518.1 site-specific DNA-methyltransferase [Candidatus Cloacimonadota bacterium]MDD5624990.1 site-specific DNA-methyltransferase [Candidatus Cloacimonadota bacterium]MDY0112082.1 site-specific DNA-methyltransferase [Candidatus Syntrophosphaera sp.]